MDTISFVVSAVLLVVGLLGFGLLITRIRKEQDAEIARLEVEEKGQSVWPYALILGVLIIAVVVVVAWIYHTVFGGSWLNLLKGVTVMGSSAMFGAQPMAWSLRKVPMDWVNRVWDYLMSAEGKAKFHFVDTRKQNPGSYLVHQASRPNLVCPDTINFHSSGNTEIGTVYFTMKDPQPIIEEAFREDPDCQMIVQLLKGTNNGG